VQGSPGGSSLALKSKMMKVTGEEKIQDESVIAKEKGGTLKATRSRSIFWYSEGLARQRETDRYMVVGVLPIEAKREGFSEETNLHESVWGYPRRNK